MRGVDEIVPIPFEVFLAHLYDLEDEHRLPVTGFLMSLPWEDKWFASPLSRVDCDCFSFLDSLRPLPVLSEHLLVIGELFGAPIVKFGEGAVDLDHKVIHPVGVVA